MIRVEDKEVEKKIAELEAQYEKINEELENINNAIVSLMSNGPASMSMEDIKKQYNDYQKKKGELTSILYSLSREIDNLKVLLMA